MVNKWFPRTEKMARAIVLSLSAVIGFSACSSTEMTATPQMVQRTASALPVTLGNTLPQSEQGNSGGVLSQQRKPSVAGVEATMAYNQANGRLSGAVVDFHNGPMTGVRVQCSEAGGGATARSCAASNAREAYLVNELSGAHSYAGTFAVNGFGPDRTENGFVAIHAGTTTHSTMNLPGAPVQYRGRFQGGGSVTQAGQTTSGTVSGDMTMQADFARGSVDATLNGTVFDQTAQAYAPLAAGFSAAVIDPNGRIYNNSDTTFSFAGSQAWGELDAAFYGPNAEEAAGTFGFGNSSGGMTGIMVGCSEYTPHNCVAPTPRF
jgi:hypothetical protein